MNSTAGSQGQAGSWPELESGPLIVGGVLLGIGSMLALIGLAVAGSTSQPRPGGGSGRWTCLLATWPS